MIEGTEAPQRAGWMEWKTASRPKAENMRSALERLGVEYDFAKRRVAGSRNDSHCEWAFAFPEGALGEALASGTISFSGRG